MSTKNRPEKIPRLSDLINNLDNLKGSPNLGLIHEGFNFYPVGSPDDRDAENQHEQPTHSINRTTDGRTYHGYPAEKKEPKVSIGKKPPVLINEDFTEGAA